MPKSAWKGKHRVVCLDSDSGNREGIVLLVGKVINDKSTEELVWGP